MGTARHSGPKPETSLPGFVASSAACGGAWAAAIAARKRGSRRAGVAGRRARGGEQAGDRAFVDNFYDVLGVDMGASGKEIKSAFRKLVRKWHPDVNKEPGAQQTFQKIFCAYEVLSDAEKRQQYDAFHPEPASSVAARRDEKRRSASRGRPQGWRAQIDAAMQRSIVETFQ